MIIKITIVDQATGLIKRRVSCQDIDVHAQIGDGEAYVLDDYDDALYTIDVATGQPVLKPPPPPPTASELLAEAQLKKLTELEALYNGAIQVDVNYLGHVFQADMESQDLLTKVLVAGGSPYWQDLANNPISLTPSELQGLAGTMLAQGQIAFANLQVRKNEVRNATTAAEVLAVNW